MYGLNAVRVMLASIWSQIEMIPCRITSRVIGSIEMLSETWGAMLLSALAISLLCSLVLTSHNNCNARGSNFWSITRAESFVKSAGKLVFENFVRVFRAMRQFAPSFILPRRGGESERGLSRKIAVCGS